MHIRVKGVKTTDSYSHGAHKVILSDTDYEKQRNVLMKLTNCNSQLYHMCYYRYVNVFQPPCGW